MSFLWPCPKCFKAARKKYKKTKKEQRLGKKEKNKNETRNKPPINPQLILPSSNLVQISDMDFSPWYNPYYHHPSMMYAAAPNDDHGYCYCSQCLDEHKKRARGKYQIPRNPSTTGSFNCVLANFGGGVGSPPPDFHHDHRFHGAAGMVQAPAVGMPARLPHHFAPPGAPAHNQHVNPPFPPPAAVNEMPNVIVWPKNVSEVSFPVVDHTADGPWQPAMYMATLPDTAEISDIVARIAPDGSGKTLMARSDKDRTLFSATSAPSLTSLRRRAIQLEVYWNKGASTANFSGEETHAGAQPATRKKPKKDKGKKTARISDDDGDGEDNEGKEEAPRAGQDLQSSSADGDGSDDDDDDNPPDGSLAFGDSVDLTRSSSIINPRAGGRKVPKLA